MALIKCPECECQISSNAECCPKCGYPIAGGGSTQAHGGKIQTVEQTSKKYKLQQLLSSLLIIVSVIMIADSSSEGADSSSEVAVSGILGLIVGLIWFIVVRFLTWWHHS